MFLTLRITLRITLLINPRQPLLRHHPLHYLPPHIQFPLFIGVARAAEQERSSPQPIPLFNVGAGGPPPLPPPHCYMPPQACPIVQALVSLPRANAWVKTYLVAVEFQFWAIRDQCRCRCRKCVLPPTPLNALDTLGKPSPGVKGRGALLTIFPRGPAQRLVAVEHVLGAKHFDVVQSFAVEPTYGLRANAKFGFAAPVLKFVDLGAKFVVHFYLGVNEQDLVLHQGVVPLHGLLLDSLSVSNGHDADEHAFITRYSLLGPVHRHRENSVFRHSFSPLRPEVKIAGHNKPVLVVRVIVAYPFRTIWSDPKFFGYETEGRAGD